MVPRIPPNAAEPSAEPPTPALTTLNWEQRYWHALHNAKRCRRLARYIVTDEQLCLGLQQLAADYETLATWLRRH